MAILAVTGNPILHSKSPNLFRAVFSMEKSEDAYFRIATDNADEAILLMKELYLSGLNVTAPFKADVMPLIDHISDEAKTIGAVNTIANEKGVLTGYNTDYIGVVESFIDNGINPAGKRTLIIGAGGAGRAAVYGLKTAGAALYIIDIAEQQAIKVADEFNATACAYASLEAEVKQADILVLAVDSSIKVLQEEWISSNQVIYDVNYKPSYLTDIAKSKNCKLITGGEMLINQAVPGFMHYFGDVFLPKKSSIKSAMQQGFNSTFSDKQKKTIAFIGFMATGKTSVGKALAKQLQWEFFDCDAEIVKRIGMPIAAYFQQHGEAAFRTIESEVLASLVSKTNCVISCGGGIVLREENRQLLRTQTLSIWLYNSIETTVKRGHDGSRPLLNVENPIETASELFKQRKGLYAASCDLLLYTEHKTPTQIATKLYAEISKTFGH